MEEQLINFETAVLAKEKGFDIQLYGKKDKTPYNQHILEKWLRDKHNIIVDIVSYYNEDQLPLRKTNIQKPVGYFAWDHYSENFTEDGAIKFEKYEDALEVGLYNALKLIE